ncbi:MAG: aspartate dehydrogenase [Armatimonadetes bacterium]|nr:aspartate dehydrogenase [Armatimonadota bacterium]
MASPLKIGLVGAGAIGAAIARAVDSGDVPGQLVGLCELDDARREALLGSLGQPVPSLDLAALCAASDVVVEAAAGAVAPLVVQAALDAGCDVLVMSVGGLLGHDELVEAARAAGRTIYAPTGAIAALDAIRAALPAGLDSVTLTTTKPPRGLAGAPWVVQQGIDLAALTEPTTIFEGSAAEAVKAFPANVNVAAALSLAGIGAERTRVRVVADPTSSVNCHRIEASGGFGRLEVIVENVPSPDNPKTSYLAALSAMALLKRLSSPLVVGT